MAASVEPRAPPLILHPLEVASLLYYSGAPDHLIAAGVLHDLIEKTDATTADCAHGSGHRITERVRGISDDDRIPGYAKRKAALRQQVAGAGDEALALRRRQALQAARAAPRDRCRFEGQGGAQSGPADGDEQSAARPRRETCFGLTAVPEPVGGQSGVRRPA
jgi:hypothetical protein